MFAFHCHLFLCCFCQLDEEQKLCQQQRDSIMSSIDSGAERLHQVVTERQMHLKRMLSALALDRSQALEEEQEQCSTSLSILINLEQVCYNDPISLLDFLWLTMVM